MALSYSKGIMAGEMASECTYCVSSIDMKSPVSVAERNLGPSPHMPLELMVKGMSGVVVLHPGACMPVWPFSKLNVAGKTAGVKAERLA